jgi:undecaprenyl-diphosphatase
VRSPKDIIVRQTSDPRPIEQISISPTLTHGKSMLNATTKIHWAIPTAIVAAVILVCVLCAVFGAHSFDFTIVLFLNKFAGKSRLFDTSVVLLSNRHILDGVLFVAVLWLIWFKDKREQSRIRLFMGGVAAVLAGLLSRLLQLTLPFHVRPLYNTDLTLTLPIGVQWGALKHWNSFPSDHASLFFALATLIWISDRRLGLFAFFWAAITSCTRIYLCLHYPTDVLGGAALGIFMVILFQRLPLPRVVYRLLDWERYHSPSFYAVAFIASYQAATLFEDLRGIAQEIVQSL